MTLTYRNFPEFSLNRKSKKMSFLTNNVCAVVQFTLKHKLFSNTEYNDMAWLNIHILPANRNTG